MSAIEDLAAEVTKVKASVDAAVVVIESRPADNSLEIVAITGDLAAVREKLDAVVAATATAASS